jgi:Tol biopolymer transport system component
MSRAIALPVAICMAVLSCLALPVQAATPDGPRITVLTDAFDARGGLDIVTMGPAGAAPQTVIENAGGNRPSWSADGNLLTFGSHGERTAVAVAAVNGPGNRVYRRAQPTGNGAVMAPDGSVVAYSYEDTIWFLDVISGTVRRAFPSRTYASFEPSSFSPDGSKLAGTVGWVGSSAIAVDLRTGRTSLLAKEGAEPTYSPDGSEVAFIRWRNWRSTAVDDGSPPINELRVARVGVPGKSRLLLRRSNLLASPGWDPSGSRLSFILSRVVENGYWTPEKGAKVMSINSDGSCLSRLFSRSRGTVYGIAWQPGPGRGAGPISC